MTKVTILGAGVTGLTIASQLPTDYDITIVGQHLPGDEPNKQWASPWAAAVWIGVHDSNERDQKMQLDAFWGLWHLAETHPESTVRKAEMTEIMDVGTPDKVWYMNKVPGFRFMSREELPPQAAYGMKYMTTVITPHKFIEWMRTRLEARGVKFQRVSVTSLADLAGLGHDVLINASGLGASKLKDVMDTKVRPVMLQSMLINHPTYKGLYVHRGNNYYTTQFARGDGPVYVGGVIEYGSDDLTIHDDKRQMLLNRANREQPEYFPSTSLADYNFLGDWNGYYPARIRADGGNRVEKDVVGGQKVVHAYGQHAGGYVNSFGMAREVAKLVSEIVYEPRTRAHL